MNIIFVCRNWYNRRNRYGLVMEELGHSVKTIEVGLHQKNTQSILENEPLDNVDMILYIDDGTYSVTITDEVLKKIKNKKILLVFFGAIVLPTDIAIKLFKPFDYVFVFNSDKTDDLKKHSGSEKYIYLPTGYFADQYYPDDNLSENKLYDVSFAGDILSRITKTDDTRTNYLKYLLKNFDDKYRIRIFGERLCKRVGLHHINKILTHEEHRNLYYKTKVNLDLPFINEIGQQNLLHIKNRFFEIPGCKEILLTKYSKEFADIFTSEKDAFYYTDNGDMVEKATWILKNYNKLKEVKNNAYVKCVNQHQYKHRFIEIFKVIQ